ncbi:hypothetical protein C8J57DRAFT_1522916 [Mycena rebaudengoi]|nr:hypothetical protein C8J57DRAFT_1522916 [Mycena rebaudengoi]
MEAKPASAVWVLTEWTYPARRSEVTEGLAAGLIATYKPEALDILESLREKPRFIRTVRAGGNSMMIPVALEELSSLWGFAVAGLIDSGATNGFISSQFMDEHGIETEPLPLAVPMYNTDGTPNKGGWITRIACL